VHQNDAAPPQNMRGQTPKPMSLVSIVVPAYNEEDTIAEFNRRLSIVRRGLSIRSEVIFVNDGSSDRTLDIMKSIKATDAAIGIVDLSRNFGKEIALTAGIDHCSGDAIVIIDADLQDPPELVPDLIELWRNADGVDVVYGQRVSRRGETLMKRLTSYGFYRVINALSTCPIPMDTGDFRLLSRRAVGALSLMRERHRFMKGLFTWVGFRQIPMSYERDPRFAGNSKWNYWKLWNFSVEGITSFSLAPLKAATYIGLITAAFSVCYGTFMIVRTLVFGNPIPGYPSLLVIILFLGGIQLVFLGVIGEYLGRTFDEVKQRPLYVVRNWEPSVSSAGSYDQRPRPPLGSCRGPRESDVQPG
jgi:polyisoprenyl-phosphate glycosyltransferase